MIFSSYNFIIFLTFFIIIYQLVNNSNKIYIIFIFNFIFYSFFNLILSIALFFDLLINYFFIVKLVSTKKEHRKGILIYAILFNVIILFFFKYTNFFIDNVNLIFNSDYKTFQILLPIGISFFTFQLISYYIDLFNKNKCHNFYAFCNYIIFFPQLIAGPILRADQIINKFYNLSNIDFTNFIKGFKFFSYGLFIKVVLADNIGFISDDIFDNYIYSLSSLDTLVASYLFGFQIYFDFSGYCLMAIGSAKIIGIDIPVNFYFPYFSKNIRDFWQRWNITLGTWVRDYIYIPLINFFKYKKNNDVDIRLKKTQAVYIFSLLISWFVMGLWHGASWNFVIWGLFHFIYIIIYRFFLSKIKYEIILWPIHINLIMISWLIFRITDLSLILQIFTNFFIIEGFFEMNLKKNIYLLTSIFLLSNFFIYIFKNIFFNTLINKNNILILIFFCFLNYFSFVYLNKEATPFIYFQF
tara:strand:- start:2597 stop:4000 length:1404 start_codon:yes stop_codon:yes gene_type:complete